jgi:hypothetical protein
LRDWKSQDDICKAFGKQDLIAAAYANTSWSKILSARNCFEKFEKDAGKIFLWPLDQFVIKEFIEWAVLVKNIPAGTVESYLHIIEIIHRLKNCDGSAYSR